MLGLVNSLIERASLASVMYGEGLAGQSGYTVSQLITATRVQYRPIVTHAEHAVQQLVQLMLDIIEKEIKSDVYVYGGPKTKQWLSLSPKDIEGYRNVWVELDPMLPTDEYAISSKTLNELQAGVRSITSSMEAIGIDQPDEELRQIRRERYMQRPEIEAFLVQEAVKRAGIKIEAEEKGIEIDQLLAAIPNMPPAMLQALVASGKIPVQALQAMVQQGLIPPEMLGGGMAAGPQVMAGPNTMATPAPRQGVSTPGPRPSGMTLGQPGGPRRTSQE
jgi:predicted nucleic acid-binding protein